MTRLRGIVFDLDGTLVDTLEDIAASMNHVLAQHGLPGHDLDTHRRFVGEGLTRLVEQASAGHPVDRDTLARQFRSHYATHMLDRSAPYPGVDALLGTLVARDVPLAVLSNKPHDATVEMVRRLFPAVAFATVLGQRDGVPRKPAPDGALEACAALAVPAHACGLIGDTGIDMATAKAAGMEAVGVVWGFRSAAELRDAGADRLLSTPGDLLGLL